MRILAVILLLFTTPADAAEITAVVVRCIDGDTLEVVTAIEEDEIIVRLWGADAPESERKGRWQSQPYSAVAREMLSAKCLNKQVCLERKGQSYSRLVARVRVIENDTDLSAEMIREGLSWWARKYAPKEKTFGELEEKARMDRRGLWADGKKAIDPEDWRRK